MKELVLGALLISMLHGGAAAQSSGWKLPASGQPVRVHGLDGTVLAGKLERLEPDSIGVAELNGNVTRLPFAAVRQIETYGRNWKKGAKRGAMGGAALSVVLIGLALHSDLSFDGDGPIIPATYLAAPIALALPVAGAGVGIVFAPTGWMTISIRH
jgi:hypothetical protein